MTERYTVRQIVCRMFWGVNQKAIPGHLLEMLVRWSQTKLLRIKVSPLDWSHHFPIMDYAGHAGLEEKI